MRLNTVLVRASTFTDNAVQSGQTYFYVVTTTDTSYSESIYSNEVMAVIP
jgi:fibronectin type 3 domain-containing protein